MANRPTIRRVARAGGLLPVGLVIAGLTALSTSTTVVHANVWEDPGVNCHANVNGTDVTAQDATNAGAAVSVPEHTQVTVAMTADQPLFRRLIRVVFIGGLGQPTTPLSNNASDGIGYTADDETNLVGDSWTTTVDVDKYSRYGIGLYQVEVETSGPRGGCEIDALVRVAGNPLGAIAGDAGAAAAFLGALGLAGSGVAAAGEGGGDSPSGGSDGGDPVDDMLDFADDMGFCFFLTIPAILMTAGSMATGGGAPPPDPPPPGTPAGPAPDEPQPTPVTPAPTPVTVATSAAAAPAFRPAHWKPRFSFLGAISGLLGATGVVVLLQQSGLVFPTITLVIIAWVAGLLAGLVVIPSLARVVAVGRINRRRLARARRAATRAQS